MAKKIVSVEKMVLTNELSHNGVVLLKYRIEYPVFRSSFYQMSLLLVNRFYRDRALGYQEYCETELFKQAVKQYEDDVANGYPVRVFEAVLTYSVTYLKACIISLYSDKYEYTGGAHGMTVRSSQTWNLQGFRLVTLPRLVRCGPDYRDFVLEQVTAQIERNPEYYFEDFETLVPKHFAEDSFYCTPAGLVVYYQLYDIAPYSTGIPEFLIPYCHCVLEPDGLCFPIREL